MKAIRGKEMRKRLRSLPPDTIIMVFPPSEVRQAEEIAAEGFRTGNPQLVCVVGQAIWDRTPVKPGVKVLITDARHLLTVFK